MSDILRGRFDSTMVSTEQRNRVLRNTYGLLALSLIPTALGAWLGVSMGFRFFAGSPFIGLMVFMAGAMGFMWAIEKNKNSGVGVALLLAFTFFMGLMLSRLIDSVLNMNNGAQLVALAFGGTAAIFAVMASLATTIKRDLSGMGQWLAVGSVVLLVAIIANIFLKIPAVMLAISALMMIVFSAYMLYDLKRVVDGGETNYVSATLAIYMDIFNVFQSLLSMLGLMSSNDD